MSEYIVTYEKGMDTIESLDGIDWYEAGKSWSKWRRRLPHKHIAQTRAWIGLTYVERCPCGAYGPDWTRL